MDYPDDTKWNEIPDYAENPTGKKMDIKFCMYWSEKCPNESELNEKRLLSLKTLCHLDGRKKNLPKISSIKKRYFLTYKYGTYNTNNHFKDSDNEGNRHYKRMYAWRF